MVTSQEHLRHGNIRHIARTHDQKWRTGDGGTKTDPNLVDVVNDLTEVDYLLKDLSQRTEHHGTNSALDSHNFCNRWLPASFCQSLQILKSRHRRHLDLVERSARWANPDDLDLFLSFVRREYLSIKSALRTAYRQAGVLLCASDWQTPIYASSMPLETNRLSQGIAEHSLDYKRDGHLDAVEYEKAFLTQYIDHLGAPDCRAYLANCGMAAFTTAINWLAHEIQVGSNALALEPMYFENLHLARGMFPELVQVSADDGNLLEQLRCHQPSVVFLDAVTNCGNVLFHDLKCVIDWAKFETTERTFLVIDTTCVPTVLLPQGLLENLPEHVCVILVESLAKYHQFGMDTVTGGIAVLKAETALQESFYKCRARLGTNIADSSVGSLPVPNRERLKQRMKRHSRNTEILAQLLETAIKETTGIIESISWLSDAPQFVPDEVKWFKGTVFSIQLRSPFKSIPCYRKYEEKVMELAQQMNHPLALSTSFGFDVSRLYITAPATAFEPPFLRVSVGTETELEIRVLAALLVQASCELENDLGDGVWAKEATAAANRQLATVAAPKAPIKVVRPPKPGIKASVFAGPTALADYLSPANFAPAPLVELPADLNPLRKDGVRLFAKMMPLVPLMNIKSVPAFSMLSKSNERGQLEGVRNIIESSSSNTVLSLSVIAKLFGIDNTCAIVDHSIAPSLVRMLRLFGIEIFLHPAFGHELFGRLEPRSQRAQDMGSQAGWLNPGQYTNPDNPEGFAQWLAPDLWAQTDGRLSVLSCGLGTCGTMVGVSRALRQFKPDLEVVACCPQPGDAVPGPREKSLLADVSFPWQDAANHYLELTADESFKASVALLRRGIMGGPSSGMNYAGVIRYLQNEKAAGRLNSRLDANGELWCAFLCCDSPLPHVDEYYDALGEEFFPPINPVPQPAK